MVGDDAFKQLGAQATRAEAARQHMGVEEHLHEASRKTSLSVK